MEIVLLIILFAAASFGVIVIVGLLYNFVYKDTYYYRKKLLNKHGYKLDDRHRVWINHKIKHIIEDACLRQSIFNPTFSNIMDRWDIQTVEYYSRYEKTHMIDSFIKADVAKYNCEGNVVYVKRWGK